MNTSTEIIDYTSGETSKRQESGASVDVAKARGAQEIQAMVIMAKQYPRSETQSFSRIVQACGRRRLAESSQYAYPRGNQTVTGPSIRLAEVLAQNWGNVDFGIVELEQADGESQVMAYCWDLETNCRQAKVFTVKHERHTRSGVVKLKDPRDIYEMVANNGARRLRACILGVIPGDIVDAAIDACNRTLAGNTDEPLSDRVRKMVVYFQQTFSVSQEMIEQRLGHKIEATIEAELVTLKQIATSLRDGMAKPADFFNMPQPKSATQTASDLGFDGNAANGKKPKASRKSDPIPEGVDHRKLNTGEVATDQQIEMFDNLENIEPEDMQRLVKQATDGRTDDYRELTRFEAEALLAKLEAGS